jgi:hypothetical protein
MRYRALFTICGISLVEACSSSSTTQVVGHETGGTAGDSSAGGGSGLGGSSSVGGSSNTGGSFSHDLNCANYCAAISMACVTGAQLQYKSDLSCLNSCPSFVVGTLQDTSNNTLGCRFSHALAAADSPDQNCAAAGPSGGGVCGTNCDAYCALMAHICPTVYENQSICFAACANMTGVDDTVFHTNISGDSLQCRIYHATFAAEGNPDIHCVHASSIPTLPCAPP